MGSSSSNSSSASQELSAASPTVRSHGNVTRLNTMCGSTFRYSPVLDDGGNTLLISALSMVKRSPRTWNLRVLM
jgi:hypothetical protein